MARSSATAVSSDSARSVTSMVSRPASRPESARARTTAGHATRRRSWTMEQFTASWTLGGQPVARRQPSESTHSPRATMSPLASAQGTSSWGG